MREKKRLEDMLANEANLIRHGDDISAYFDLAREGESVDGDLRREIDSLANWSTAWRPRPYSGAKMMLAMPS